MITRREFNLTVVSAALSVPFRRAAALTERSAGGASDVLDEVASANFAPFGYLDNPYHCWNLHPSGVFRSLPGVGFGLYYPAGPGGYFDFKKNNVYQASLRLGFVFGQRTLWTMDDFRDGELTAVHHSKDVFTYRVRVDEADVLCTFFQCGEDTLAVRVTSKGSLKADGPFRLIAGHAYELGGAQWWGGDGVAGSYHAPEDAWITHGFAAGTVFATGADTSSQAHGVRTGTDVQQNWREANNTGEATAYESASLQAALYFDVTPDLLARGITLHMSRGVNRAAALRELKRSKLAAGAELNGKRSADAEFWKDAPRLTGNWPRHWKNGWVYDFETLRMMVRRPIGNYKHPWDAMQIQSPRSVLAETSIDMWALSYVDPASAKKVFTGQFLDAIEPNVPCAREDGVTNMVATDGSECGTSISWCYPFYCAKLIYERTGDPEWIAVLYPKLSEFLEWTLKNRVDKEKFIIAKCSWESGMDGSKRFLIKEPTGGETTEFARLVELQAATAQAASILAEMAGVVGKESDAGRWKQIQNDYAHKTQQMWNGSDWFEDFDTRSMKAITSVGRDVGQVAPIFCGIATSEQARSMIPTLRNLYEDSRAGKIDMGQDPLLWSSLVLPYVESLWAAGQLELLADVIHTISERIYKSTDRRSVSNEQGHKLGWPGVSCEVWGPEGARGGEGYGWGAVMPAHILRNIVGIRETETPDRIFLSPNLPKEFLNPGETFGIRDVALRPGRLSVSYAVGEQGRLRISGTWGGGSIRVEGKDGAHVADGEAGKLSFEGQNRGVYQLVFKDGRSKGL